jgi:probable phosphoglycerate mutase
MEGTRVVLIRHGESRAQEGQFVGGHDGCQGLSDRGRDQAALLRDRLVASAELEGATALYASLMERAFETASIIAPALGGLEIQRECGFCEGHPGEADGLTFTELAERRPTGGWDPNHRYAPDWETWVEMAGRVADALDQIVERHPGELVVVACHGGVIVHSMLRWLGFDPTQPEERAWFAPANTSLTEWRFGPNPYANSTVPIQLVRFNDHAHLAGTDLRL